MRNAFLALVLINLGFATWHQWFADRPRATRLLVQTGPTISLADETRARDGQAEPGDAVPAEPRGCVSIGSFPNRVVVTEVTSTLDAAGFHATQRVAQGDVWLGHWVYIDAIPTQSEAAAIVGNLTANGINDAYVIADGNRGSLVSLGVFSIEERAQQRLSAASALGYAPVIVDRYQPGDVYWLDVRADDGRTFSAAELLALIDQETSQTAECVSR